MYNVLLWTMCVNQKLDLFHFIFCLPGPVFFALFLFLTPFTLARFFLVLIMSGNGTLIDVRGYVGRFHKGLFDLIGIHLSAALKLPCCRFLVTL